MKNYNIQLITILISATSLSSNKSVIIDILALIATILSVVTIYLNERKKNNG